MIEKSNTTYQNNRTHSTFKIMADVNGEEKQLLRGSSGSPKYFSRSTSRAGAMLHGLEGKRIFRVLACLRVRCIFEIVT